LCQQYFSSVQKKLTFVWLKRQGTQVSSIHARFMSQSFILLQNMCLLKRSLLQQWSLLVVLQVPGVGRVKALALLKHFSSLQQLCNAAPSQLEPIVGQAAALLIHHFFNKPVKPVCF
uniref:DisA/LigA helix-hairpin-helix motif domain-containing protein n=1 Tax=Takifugu rubripes TaxID=31033 RepID=A0A674PEG5_TAKRU